MKRYILACVFFMFFSASANNSAARLTSMNLPTSASGAMAMARAVKSTIWPYSSLKRFW